MLRRNGTHGKSDKGDAKRHRAHTDPAKVSQREQTITTPKFEYQNAVVEYQYAFGTLLHNITNRSYVMIRLPHGYRALTTPSSTRRQQALKY